MVNILAKVKEKLSTPERKRVVENFVSLSVLQALNYLLPLLTLPYLVRVLTPDRYGLVNFAQAVVAYLVLLTDYGFNLSATQAISVNRDNKDKISRIFSSTMTVKIILCLLSAVILVALVGFVPKFRADWLVYVYTFGTVIGTVLFPLWFFQGMEKMKQSTILNVIAKVVFTVLVFVFIHQSSDYVLVPLLNSLGMFVAGLGSLGIIVRQFKVKFSWPTVGDIKEQFKDGWHVFLSTAAVSLYTASNTFILGLFTNNTIVGYYSAAEKLVRAIQGLLSPVSQAVYPYLSKLVENSKEGAIKVIQKLALGIGGGMFVVSFGALILAGPIVNIILGNQYQQSILVLQIMAFIPFVTGLSNVFGTQTMLTFGMKKAFSHVLLFAGIFNILLALILAPTLKQNGIAIAVMATETFVTVTMFFALRKKGVHVFKGQITKV